MNNRIIETNKEFEIMNRLFTTALSALSLVAIVSPSFAQDIVAIKNRSTKIDYLNQVRLEHKINHNNQVNITKDKEVVVMKDTSSQGVHTPASTKIEYLNQIRLNQSINN